MLVHHEGAVAEDGAASPRAGLKWFVRHYVEMLVAMAAGMAVLGYAQALLLRRAGWSDYFARDDLALLVMGVNMALPMGLWMQVRGHERRRSLEMAAVGFVPAAALLLPLRLQAVSAETASAAAHLVMLAGMAILMLVRRNDHTAIGH